MQDYLAGLNTEQRRAVEHREGPLMIVAGAGSGKTKVLTTRIAHLLRSGVDAYNILALTFTNKAAAEMRERIEHILGNNEAKNLFCGTFHSIFARIMRAEATKLGYPSNFTIYDTDDQRGVIREIIKELNLDDKHYKPAFVGSRISAAKNNLIDPAGYKQNREIQTEDVRSNRQAIGEIYERYANRLARNGAMDFDDLLFKMYVLLTNFPDVLAKYQHRFKFILIDEYQDTNLAQYAIIKMLGAVHENICVVGDDAQSIYSFRGATVKNILQFQDDYEDVQVIKLEQNYRSTQLILDAANTVIGNNKNQIPKNLWTEKEGGEKIKLVRTLTDNDEGKFVADAITEMKLRYHHPNKDFVILYRTNSQSRSFEESLRRMNIPYKLVGGTSFYQRKEVKDFLAYLRVVVNPRDEEMLKRIINYPVRGIGKTSIDKITLAANTSGRSFWEVLQIPELHGIRGAGATALENFTIMIRAFQSMLAKGNAYEMAFAVGKQTGLVAELYNDKSVEGLSRYENVQALLNSIKEFTETPNEDGELQDTTLGAYLQQITLLTDSDKEDPENADAVRLMTIHAAKGLEFPCVFAVGLEENLFPSSMSMYDRDSLEEERRLFYVVVTRAKERLWITYANSRYRFGQLVQNDPSRFIEEVPDQHLDRSFTGAAHSARGSVNAFGKTMNQSFSKTAPQSMDKTTPLKKLAEKLATPKPTTHQLSETFRPDNPNDMEAGMKVEHQKFGFGMIQAIEGNAANRIATIDFGAGGGIKKIVLNYAKLMIVR